MTRPLNPYGVYYAYLRKSRADREAEARGELETLQRHESMLKDLAKKLGITIQKFYREVVSGETIQNRPVVQELLNDISTGACDGVLVVEVERLARGDTADQGTIANYFKFSDTLIITPLKIYDPTDEFDEEYFEFGLFMSRREYKTINRRLQNGRMTSLSEGKWICSTAPDGYNRVRIKNDKGYTLEPNPERVPVIQLIFNLRWYGEKQEDGSYRRLGHFLIAKRLDSLGIKPLVGDKWSPSTIKDILQNYAYIGKVTWGRKPEKKSLENGKVKKTRIDNSDFLIYNGKHPALIDEKIFYGIQEIEENNRRMAKVVSNKILKNPLSGIVKCGKCGSPMTRRINNGKDRYYTLGCPNRYCDTVSSPLYLIEEQLLSSLKKWLDGYILSFEESSAPPEPDDSHLLENSLKDYEKELSVLKEQHAKTFDLLEQGIYSPEIFQERSTILSSKINTIIVDIDKIKKSISENKKKLYQQQVFIPEFQKILDVYFDTESAQARNDMLKNILDSVDYTKSEPNKKFCRDNANFKLVLHPKLPKF